MDFVCDHVLYSNEVFDHVLFDFVDELFRVYRQCSVEEDHGYWIWYDLTRSARLVAHSLNEPYRIKSKTKIQRTRLLQM